MYSQPKCCLDFMGHGNVFRVKIGSEAVELITLGKERQALFPGTQTHAGHFERDSAFRLLQEY